MVEFTGRPDRFLALHFANRVWKFNTAEVMGTTQTDPAVFATVEEFATEIGMVPIAIHKEKAGYVRQSSLIHALSNLSGEKLSRSEATELLSQVSSSHRR